MAGMPLREADKVEILTLVHNAIDILMADTPQAKRFPLRCDALTRESLVAEHGFAALVSVSSSNTSESLLFDAGLSKNGLIHNMDVLEVRPKDRVRWAAGLAFSRNVMTLRQYVGRPAGAASLVHRARQTLQAEAKVRQACSMAAPRRRS
jgi:hypothetical protein